MFFTSHACPFSAAIKYDRKTHLVSDVVDAIVKAFPTATAMDPYIPGVVVVAMKTQEEVSAAISGPQIPCSPAPLRAYRTVHSTGSRVKIRVDRINLLQSQEEQIEAINEIFGAYGRIIHMNSHYARGSTNRPFLPIPLVSYPVIVSWPFLLFVSPRSVTITPSLDFTLEIPKDSPKNILIPRVAQVKGTNTLFHWHGPQYCYRCGEENHIKQDCPKPAEFELMSAPDVNILAPAFLTPGLAPQPTSSKVTFKFTKDVQAPKPTKATSASSLSKGEWTKVSYSKKDDSNKRARATAGRRSSSTSGASASASDSEASSRPERKKTARTTPPQTSTVPFVSLPEDAKVIALPMSPIVIDGTETGSSPPTVTSDVLPSALADPPSAVVADQQAPSAPEPCPVSSADTTATDATGMTDVEFHEDSEDEEEG
ncbi:hypothetical protein EDD11_001875 [Mortierella claussenii]|nr:hypothetical protein EDD11_001875 [Mortierella claussenii]